MNGLNDKEINLRIQNKQVNYDSDVKTKTVLQIINENVFTLFNLLNFILAILVILTHSYKNLLFMGVVICNTIISTVQMIRSKKIIDQLSIINSKKVRAIRNNIEQEIDINEIVVDDILIYKIGSQIITDAVILSGNVCVNESFITGESDIISYTVNDELKSGSFITSGNCKVRVIRVGDNNYTSTITRGAKYIKKINSELLNSLNKIIKIVSVIIIPIGLLLFYNQILLTNINQAILNTVAALLAMIPEGLILLTSTVLAVATIKLSKKNILVQELFCIEMLARVDTICLDKTGTLTTGNMKVKDLIIFNDKANEIISNIINYMDDNATTVALKDYFEIKNNYTFINSVPFSSENKYASYEFKEGKFLIGAPEIICNKIKDIDKYQKDYRVLLVMGDEPIALILINDEIRISAKNTLKYLKNESVDVKIISGDNINTIKNIAESMKMKVKAIDLSNVELTNDIVLNNNVFARVSPNQKKQIVTILQKNNHVVAMVGDGVNDVLALKQADCSITFKEATSVARNVSQIILLDSTFDNIPKIIEEGRQTINNVQKSAALYLSKTLYASLLAIIFIFVNLNYPFQPIQLTLINFFTIGVPSIVLALEPNKDKIKGKFLLNIFKTILPSSILVIMNVLVISNLNMNYNELSTICVFATVFIGFVLIYRLSKPLNKTRKCLLIILSLLFILSIIILKNVFSLVAVNIKVLLIICIIDLVLYMLLMKLVNHILK